MVEVLYEDNHLLVLNKPAGLLTQPSGTNDDSLEARAKAWLKEKYNKPGNVFLEAVHRLDRAASGIVVFARTSKALSRLTGDIRSRNVRKVYRALVERKPQKKQEELEHYLLHEDFRARPVKREMPGAKPARLLYRTIEQTGEGALLEVELITGRYHQIRAQLAAIGCPIGGDKKYGARKKRDLPGIALHHSRFEIPHPVTKQWLIFESPPPW